MALLQNERNTRLRNSAAPGAREILEQQEPTHQRAHDRADDALHRPGADEHPTETLRKDDERDDNQPHQSTDYE